MIKTSPEKRNSRSLGVAHKGRGDFSPLRIRRGSNFKSSILISSHISGPCCALTQFCSSSRAELSEIHDSCGAEVTASHSSHPVGGPSQAHHEQELVKRAENGSGTAGKVLCSSPQGQELCHPSDTPQSLSRFPPPLGVAVGGCVSTGSSFPG